MPDILPLPLARIYPRPEPVSPAAVPSIPSLLLPLTPAHARQHNQRLGEHALDAVAKTLIMVEGGVGRGMYPWMYPRPKAVPPAAVPSVPLLLLPSTPTHTRQHYPRLGGHTLDAVAKTPIRAMGNGGQGMYLRIYPQPEPVPPAAVPSDPAASASADADQRLPTRLKSWRARL